jgi:HEPN domain-containing protein
MTLLEQWLYKAEEDLGSAKLLLSGNFYGTAIYHTQQAAEKALKAYCVYISIAIPRTHNLDSLCQLCESSDADFSNIYLYAIDLNGLDVAFRYPNVQFEPTATDVQNAIQLASDILNFVKTKCV